ncbi:MAG: ribonuclease HI [Candidatus Lloydbacteria bacterium RIFCSPHIGHO2_01_FULL_41_20]|uniref:Ribonuclease H n=1 Tax=Candidatus Lloydbacteria bacterium RIFCSPHIGHO2_01_FULL_41_20 TaxID=1798657 RepID=A0A1G2CRK3_9BACT|nr:MAG: ribonuclease HI [Candidatus Lloydbacteria bacterium RIFCSPHIGHO2_01_FULL_41_20]
MKEKILVYADGSAIGNPGPGGWGAVLVFYKNQNGAQGSVLEIGGGNKHTTNNRMELTAAIEALKTINKSQVTSHKLIVRTDSSYVINGITKWVKNWQKNKWKGVNKKPISNKDLWVKLDKLVKGKKIDWEYVPGHVGVVGNERVDFIANLCAREKQYKTQRFFDGPLSKYPFDIFDTKQTKNKPASKRKSSKGTAYSYLSLVGGVLMTHKSWAECEKRVKGVSGAKFKKATSPEDEEKIIHSWGVNPPKF